MPGLDECVAYFHKNSGFARLMDGLFDMYARYERCFGAVRITDPSDEEERAISDYFKRDYYDQALIRIGLAEFERQAQRLFAPELTLRAILEAYARRPLFRNKLDGKGTVNAFSLYLERDLTSKYIGTDAENWVKDLIQHMRRSYRSWADKYLYNPNAVVEPLESICEALTNLPVFGGKRERLSDFAARFMQDPHAFDYYGSYGAYFMRALAKTFNQPVPVTPEEYSGLCFSAGLLSDGLLNRIVLRGLIAYIGRDEEPVCAVFNRRQELHVLTLENMSRFTAMKAVGNKVFVIENMNVFSAVCERARDSNCTIVCVENSMNVAFTFLIDMLIASGTKELFYSGSVDYRGLSLADKVYLKYPKEFIAWRYEKSDYDRVVSEHEFYMPDSRRDMGLHNEELASLLSHMRKKGKTAPQTALINDLVTDIQSYSF